MYITINSNDDDHNDESEDRIEDLLDTKGIDLIPADEILLFMGRITARVTSLVNQHRTLDAVTKALAAQDGYDYTEEPLLTFMEELDSLESTINRLYTYHRDLMYRALEEI